MKIEAYRLGKTVDNIKLGIDWSWFNFKPSAYSNKQNKWRAKNGFPKVIDEGCYFLISLYWCNSQYSVRLILRPFKHEPLKVVHEKNYSVK